MRWQDITERMKMTENNTTNTSSTSTTELVNRLALIIEEMEKFKQWMKDENIVEQERQDYLDQGLEPPA